MLCRRGGRRPWPLLVLPRPRLPRRLAPTTGTSMLGDSRRAGRRLVRRCGGISHCQSNVAQQSKIPGTMPTNVSSRLVELCSCADGQMLTYESRPKTVTSNQKFSSKRYSSTPVRNQLRGTNKLQPKLAV